MIMKTGGLNQPYVDLSIELERMIYHAKKKQAFYSHSFSVHTNGGSVHFAP